MPFACARFVLALSLALVVLTACGGPTGPAARVQVDAARAATATLGPDGGSLVATAADGTRYTLDVPEGALLALVEVTMAPIRAIDEFPAAAGVAAGVDFRPEGLVFFHTAHLTIEPGPGVSSTMGFAYAGDGDDLQLYPATVDDGIAVLRLSSFSGYGLANLTRDEIRDFPVPSAPGAAARAALAQLLADGTSGVEDFALALMVWWLDGLRPLLLAAEADPGANDQTYRRAELEYLQWWEAMLLFEIGLEPPFLSELLAEERAESTSLIAAALRRGFEVRNQQCFDAPDIEGAFAGAYGAARFILAAQRLGLDEPAFALDRAYLLGLHCLQAELDDVDVSPGAAPGQTTRIDVRAGYRLGDRSLRRFPAMRIDIDVWVEGGTGFAELRGYTDGDGRYAADLTWPPQVDELTVEVEACFDWEEGLILFGLDICTRETVVLTPVEVELEVYVEGVFVASTYLTSLSSVGPENRVYDELDQDVVALGPITGSLAREVDVSASASGGGGGVSGSGRVDNENVLDATFTPSGAVITLSTTIDAAATMTQTPDGDEAASVAFAYSSVGVSIGVEGAPVSYTLTAVITYSAPLASGSDGSEVRLSGSEGFRHRDIRDSRTIAEAGVLAPGTHAFEVSLAAEAGVYANPLPEYGDLFDFPEDVVATLELTLTVSR